jgi:4-hydroxy-L-threonine phosphate dehydrogenase PdxA
LVKLAVTLGDPEGIGPEVVDKALTFDAEITVLGSRTGGGKEALAAIDQAVDLALAKKVDGIVTAPVSKERIAKTGVPFIGHTEHLAARAGVKQPVMCFVAGTLRVALVTTHVSLRKLPAMITADRILGILRETATALRDSFGVLEPRLAVCGLTPCARRASSDAKRSRPSPRRSRPRARRGSGRKVLMRPTPCGSAPATRSSRCTTTRDSARSRRCIRTP